MGEVFGRLFETPLGRFALGIILLSLAPLIVALTMNINLANTSIVLPDNTTITVPVGTIWGVLKAFLPLFIVIAGLYYLGVRI